MDTNQQRLAGLPPLPGPVERALGERPLLEVPADFAARVAAKAVAQPKMSTPRLAGWGPRLAAGSAVLLTGAMFALAPHAVPQLGNAAFDAELMLLAELGGVLLFAHRWLLPE